MIKVSPSKYAKICNDYKGVYSDFDGTTPEWKGKRTVLGGCIDPSMKSCLLIEGVHFEIGY